MTDEEIFILAELVNPVGELLVDNRTVLVVQPLVPLPLVPLWFRKVVFEARNHEALTEGQYFEIWKKYLQWKQDQKSHPANT